MIFTKARNAFKTRSKDSTSKQKPSNKNVLTSSKWKSIVSWAASIFLLLSGIIYLVSFGSLLFFLAALLVCPLKRVRNLLPLKKITDRIPAAIPHQVLFNATGIVLYIVGCFLVPMHGGFTVAAYSELQRTGVGIKSDIEYTNETISVRDYLFCSNKYAELAVQGDVDAKRVGNQTIKVKLSEGAFTRSETLSILVRDTLHPSIVLEQRIEPIELNSEFDPMSVIESVEDPIDGPLVLVDAQPQAEGSKPGIEEWYSSGWYMVESTVDISKAGTYEVAVIAEDRHGNRSKEVAPISVVDPLETVSLEAKTSVLEYSNKQVDATTLVTCSDENVQVTATNLDLSTLGEKSVTYTLQKGKLTKDVAIDFTVRDTKRPVIELGSEDLSIEQGAAFDCYSNIISVRDEVDGDLRRIDAEISENGDGWYTVTGSYDVNTPGKYYFEVISCDKNGNRTTKEYSLTVKASNLAMTNTSQTYSEANAHDYVLNVNTMKFHYPSCKDVKKMSDSNRRDVHLTRDEIIAQGYSACGHCHP